MTTIIVVPIYTASSSYKPPSLHLAEAKSDTWISPYESAKSKSVDEEIENFGSDTNTPEASTAALRSEKYQLLRVGRCILAILVIHQCNVTWKDIELDSVNYSKPI